ncbi:MAG: RNA polymerase sigma factor [Bacilli bacterium]|nr:RNA polymerase sigma factor [Bacilli bacterium]MDY6430634.1 RNA polymerase sigma factor [Bacilli bacterium]
MNDESLLRKALSSKEKLMKVYESFYYKYKGLVAFVASRYLSDSNDIDDVVSETFLSLFNDPSRVKSSVKGYLISFAKGKSLDLLKTRKGIDEVINVEEIVTSNSSLNYSLIIDELKKSLSEIEFKILILHLVEGLSLVEVSKTLDFKLSKTKSIYFRALPKAKIAIGGKQDER